MPLFARAVSALPQTGDPRLGPPSYTSAFAVAPPGVTRAAEAQSELSTGSTGRWGGKWLVRKRRKTLQMRQIQALRRLLPVTF
jgi:hypothetical protein